ncbi:ABC-three component system middle component 7 [Schaalia sp. lx-100]|uniref:ABC-three component system middle component 7 n=1 Tax=Schaalia sp. lx-100 TaxID=2899081 RepID=UPI003FA7D001
MILRLLDAPKTPNELAVDLAPVTTDPTRLIDALDCLYALGKVTLSEEGALERC